MFGTVLFGRMTGGAGADRALGLFVNTLPLRLSLDGRSVEQAVHETHAAAGASAAARARFARAGPALQRCATASAAILRAAELSLHTGRRRKSGRGRTRASSELNCCALKSGRNYPCTLSVDDLGDMGFELEVQIAGQIDPAQVCRYMQTALGASGTGA